MIVKIYAERNRNKTHVCNNLIILKRVKNYISFRQKKRVISTPTKQEKILLLNLLHKLIFCKNNEIRHE